MKKILVLILTVAAITLELSAQVVKPVKWQITQKKVSEGVYDIVCKATIDATWHLYDSKLPDGGPLPTTFNMDEDETKGVTLEGGFKATTKPQVEVSAAFDNMELKYFETTATFVQRVKVKPGAKLVGYVEFMACCGGQCIPPAEADFNFTFTK